MKRPNFLQIFSLLLIAALAMPHPAQALRPGLDRAGLEAEFAGLEEDTKKSNRNIRLLLRHRFHASTRGFAFVRFHAFYEKSLSPALRRWLGPEVADVFGPFTDAGKALREAIINAIDHGSGGRLEIYRFRQKENGADGIAFVLSDDGPGMENPNALLRNSIRSHESVQMFARGKGFLNAVRFPGRVVLRSKGREWEVKQRSSRSYPRFILRGNSSVSDGTEIHFIFDHFPEWIERQNLWRAPFSRMGSPAKNVSLPALSPDRAGLEAELSSVRPEPVEGRNPAAGLEERFEMDTAEIEEEKQVLRAREVQLAPVPAEGLGFRGAASARRYFEFLADPRQGNGGPMEIVVNGTVHLYHRNVMLTVFGRDQSSPQGNVYVLEGVLGGRTRFRIRAADGQVAYASSGLEQDEEQAVFDLLTHRAFELEAFGSVVHRRLDGSGILLVSGSAQQPEISGKLYLQAGLEAPARLRTTGPQVISFGPSQQEWPDVQTLQAKDAVVFNRAYAPDGQALKEWLLRVSPLTARFRVDSETWKQVKDALAFLGQVVRRHGLVLEIQSTSFIRRGQDQYLLVRFA